MNQDNTDNTTKNYCVDTNWLIMYLTKKDNLVIEDNAKYFITRFAIIEFLSNPDLSKEEAEFSINFFKKNFYIIEIDDNVSQIAGKLLRLDEKLDLGNAILMACCLSKKLQLLSFNRPLLKYYNQIQNHPDINIKSFFSH